MAPFQTTGNVPSRGTDSGKRPRKPSGVSKSGHTYSREQPGLCSGLSVYVTEAVGGAEEVPGMVLKHFTFLNDGTVEFSD